MTSSPHDALFKSVFQQPENAAAELQHILTPQHVSAIDWSTLALEPGSYVDEKLADQHSDLLFSARTRGAGDPVLIYLLFEHQSSPEPLMALRLLGYMVQIWTRHADANRGKPLPVVIPAVLAQVRGGWKASTRFSELFSPAALPLAETVIPDFTYAVDDLDHAADEDLQGRAVAQQVRIALWLMRDARDTALLLQRLATWASDIEALALMPDGERALIPLLHYIIRVVPDLQLSQIHAILKHRAPMAESITMTIEERLRAEGEAKGKAQALALILEARSIPVDVETQARFESLSVDDLDALLRRAASVSSLDDLLS